MTVAAELLPARGVVSTSNFMFAQSDVSVVTGASGSEQALYPGRNLLNPLRSIRYRSDIAASASAVQLVFDLGATQGAQLPTMLALVDSNIQGGHTTLLGGDDSNLSSPQQWSLTNGYTQATGNRTLRWYLGDPDSTYGTATAHRFWSLLWSITDGYTSFVELGAVWLGNYTPLTTVNPQIKVIDPTKTALSYNGARYPDAQPAYHGVTFDSKYMGISSLLTLKNALDGVGGADPVWLDIYANTTDTTKKAHGSFYGYFNDKQVLQYAHPNSALTGDIKIDFVEAQD